MSAFLACSESASNAHRLAQDKETCFFYPQRMGTDSAWVGGTDIGPRALATLEGIGFSLRRLIAEDLQRWSPRPSICATGGGSGSRFSLQLLADVLNCEVRRGDAAPLLGATAMALGTPPPTKKPTHTFTPKPDKVTLYDRLYRRWRAQLPG